MVKIVRLLDIIERIRPGILRPRGVVFSCTVGSGKRITVPVEARDRLKKGDKVMVYIRKVRKRKTSKQVSERPQISMFVLNVRRVFRKIWLGLFFPLGPSFLGELSVDWRLTISEDLCRLLSIAEGDELEVYIRRLEEEAMEAVTA